MVVLIRPKKAREKHCLLCLHSLNLKSVTCILHLFSLKSSILFERSLDVYIRDCHCLEHHNFQQTNVFVLMSLVAQK